MDQLLHLLRQIVGTGNVLTGPDVVARSARWVAETPNQAMAIVRPGSTAEVAAVVRACNDAGTAIVPVGGNTGLVGATIAGPEEIQLSLERLRAVEEIDTAARTMTVQSGASLASVQDAADAAGFLFPLDLGARGTATIGGNISTNAGGNGVIRFGMMREQVLGLEVVLADGTILSNLSKVLKNNAGYDLKQLFIGSEGTLGIVTRAVLRLRPKPASRSTAIVAVRDFPTVVRMLGRLEAALGGSLTAFEVMWANFWALMATDPHLKIPAFETDDPFYVLIETQGVNPEGDAAHFEAVLGALLEDGLAADAVIAQSAADRESFWAIRDNIPYFSTWGPYIAFDISIPLGEMETYCDTIEKGLRAAFGAPDYAIFGHLGDANIHVIVGLGGEETERLYKIEEIVYAAVGPHHGSISAEHGIGIDKRDYLKISRTPAEIAAMKAVKAALDPKGVLNPGKIFE